jgi:hypothetical protein
LIYNKLLSIFRRSDMGLDMYVMTTKEPEFDFTTSTKLFYWRKHPDLHGWMENTYQKRGGTEEFNGIPIRLQYDDILQLENDIRNANLPQTTGFFFGSSSPEDKENDLEFIKLAKEALNKHDKLFYTSSW